MSKLVYGILPVVAIGIALSTKLASADEPPIKRPTAAAAVDHLSKGTKLYNVRSFDQAAEQFKQGALVEPTPIFDYNLGQCYRQMGQYKDAIWHYERFLKASPETTERNAHVRNFITQMEAELEKKAMTAPPIEAASSTVSREEIAASTPTTREAGLSDVHQPIQNSIRPRWYEDTLGWTFAGAGFVGVVVSGGLFVDASGVQEDADRAASQQVRIALQDKADSRTLTGAVVGIAAAGLLATGVIKLALHDSSEPTTTAWHLSFTSNGVVAFGRF